MSRSALDRGKGSLVAVLACCLAGGCLFAEHRRLQEARRELAACRAANPEPRVEDACSSEEAKVAALLRDYESAAERQWSCERLPDGCAPPDPVR